MKEVCPVFLFPAYEKKIKVHFPLFMGFLENPAGMIMLFSLNLFGV